MDRGAEGQTVPCAPARWAAVACRIHEQPMVQKNGEAVTVFVKPGYCQGSKRPVGTAAFKHNAGVELSRRDA